MSLTIFNRPEQPISAGNGEYVVYHKQSTGQMVAPSRQTFERAYAVLNHFNSPNIDDRYAVIRGKIKEIDPTLEITFIPRTYYELHFLKKGIKEDLARNDFCPNEGTRPDPYAHSHADNCWHLAYFDREEDNNAPAVKTMAFMMNQSLFKKLSKRPLEQDQLRYQTICELTNKQTQFFQRFHQTFDLSAQNRNGKFLSGFFSREGTPIHKFSYGSLQIRNEKDAEIVRNAVALECHSIAEKAHLLYRGTDFPTDLPYSPDNPNKPYSFSFGSGLFAGTLFAQGTTPYNYIRDSKDGYVMAVPAKEMPHAPFAIPDKHPICHLSANDGVVFHPRSKVWATNETVYGFGWLCDDRSTVSPYFSHLDRETLVDQVLDFKNRNVVFLKSTDQPVLALPPAFQPTIHIFSSVPSGKTLYIRGEEGGLNWQKGQPLVQVGEDHWIYRISKNFEHLQYKILIDDVTWEVGENHRLNSVSNVEETPYFDVPATPSSGKSTRLSVRCNAGSGFLTIRGSGPDLSWDRSAPLKKVGDDLWVWESSKPFGKMEYKLLLNDTQWEKGTNHSVEKGKKIEVTPRF